MPLSILLPGLRIEPEKKQDILDGALLAAVQSFPETLVAALLQADANANASNGNILAQAIGYGRPETMIKLLHENGADFNDALATLEGIKNWTDEAKEDAIRNLKKYREKYTGEPADKMSALLQEMAEMRKELTELRKAIPTAQNAPAAPEAPVAPAAPAPSSPTTPKTSKKIIELGKQQL